ncbi:MAG: hypothetical protein HY303_10890, partial [Candidatus Wallbacteria bacterium]|nr:hypothetical protein [Candidatus Wallbacteria bacterium]
MTIQIRGASQNNLRSLDLALAIPNPRLSLAAGAIKPWTTESTEECRDDLTRWCRKRRVP